MREITTHKVDGCNEKLEVRASDALTDGGAPREYDISGFVLSREYQVCDSKTLEPLPGKKRREVQFGLSLPFQDGPVKEVGTNGITHEALLAVLIDRLEHFQQGPFAFACDENAAALIHLRFALDQLKHRTLKRLERGGEGTLEK